MSKIKSVTRDGNHQVTVNQSAHTFSYVRPVNTRAKQGRSLTIETDDGTVVLGGTQINTIKRILEKAGEINA